MNNLIQVILVAFGTIVTALMAVHNSNSEDYKSIIKDLTADRDEWKHNYHVEAEKNEKLEKEIDMLREADAKTQASFLDKGENKK